MSQSVLDEAVRLRALGPGRLSIVHVLDWGLFFGSSAGLAAIDMSRISADADAWLDGVVAATPRAEKVFLEGYPPTAVCDWAATADVDLLIASSSRGLVDRVLLGSFAGYLTRHAPCSVLLTRPRVGDSVDTNGSSRKAASRT